MSSFIGYHASNTHNLDENPFKGSTTNYIEYLGDIIQSMPPQLKNKIIQKVNEHNKYCELYNENPINLANLPKKAPSNVFRMQEFMEQYRELAEMVDEVIGGIIFVDKNQCKKEYGNECYEIYMDGEDFFQLKDKLDFTPDNNQTAFVYVYYNQTKPVFQKIKQKNLQLTEDYKSKLQKLAGLEN